MSKKKSSKFYRTILQIEVFSKEKFNEDGKMDLHTIGEHINWGYIYGNADGSCAGNIKTIINNEVKSGAEMVELLENQGCTPYIFGLDENGNHIDDSESKVNIVISHAHEQGLDTYFLSIKKSLSFICGIYGDWEDVEEDTQTEIKKIIKKLNIKYDTNIDNLRIEEVPNENNIDNL